MALFHCDECNARISDKAAACPHCGAPVQAPLLPTNIVAAPPKGRPLAPAIMALGLIGGLAAIMYALGPSTPSTSQPPAKRTQEEVNAQRERATAIAANKQREAAERAAREQKEKEAKEEKTRELLWVAKGQDAVRAKLRDPDSAKFSDLYFHRGKDGIPVSCGRVNSKNAFGGYGGAQRFVSGGSPDMTFLEEQVTDFNVVWNRLCRN